MKTEGELLGPNGERLEFIGKGVPRKGDWYMPTWGEYKPVKATGDWGAGAERELLREIPEAVPAPPKKCKHGDPFCPCQDGDSCNHEPEAVPRRETESAGRIAEALDVIEKRASVPASGERPAPRFIPEVRRKEDMSPDGMLWLIRQEDGDIIVTILPDSETDKPMASVEFCSCGAGGGRSPKTLAALRALMIAMEEDNAE